MALLVFVAGLTGFIASGAKITDRDKKLADVAFWI